MEEITILVNSCDKYEDAWLPFFKLLKIQWPDCGYNIALSTETKKFECDFLGVRTINCPVGLSWTARLKHTLNQIDSEYVLFFLEDFFLLEKVRTDIFDKAVSLIKSDENIGLITFNKRAYGAEFPAKTDLDKCFTELKKSHKARTNVLVGLWRKEYFLKLITGDEDPWEYEKNSNIRSRYAGYKIYTQDYGVSEATFRYCMNPKDGFGITQGKWLRNNKRFFEENGIFDVNYENLGMFENEISYQEFDAQFNEYRRISANEEAQLLKNQPVSVRIREKIYTVYKKFKKSRVMKKVEYYKVCSKYRQYYKNMK